MLRWKHIYMYTIGLFWQLCQPENHCCHKFKDAMPVSFDQHCLHLTVCYTKAVNLLSKIWKTAKYSYVCMLKYLKKTSLKTFGPQIWFCLFVFQPITLKQLKSLTTIDMFSCLCGPEVTHQTAGAKWPWFDSRLWRGFLCLLLICCCDLRSWAPKPLLDMQFCSYLKNVITFSVHNIFHNCDQYYKGI